LPEEYKVHTTFNVFYLRPFVVQTKKYTIKLRTNPLEEGRGDGRPLKKGLTIKEMAKYIQEECET